MVPVELGSQKATLGCSLKLIENQGSLQKCLLGLVFTKFMNPVEFKLPRKRKYWIPPEPPFCSLNYT